MIFRKTLFTLLVASAAASDFVEPPEDVRVLSESPCPPEGVTSGDSCDIFNGEWGECSEKDPVIACENGDRTCRCDGDIPFECSCYGVFAERVLGNETLGNETETDDFVEEEEEAEESMKSAAATTSVLAALGALAASALVLTL